MPTATSTITTTTTTTTARDNVIPLKPSISSSLSTTTATLRSLYTRAARAFLHRNVALTHSLLTSAFALIHPPSSPSPDPLTSQRRKWDILRITLETTLYASPPLAKDLEVLPPSLRANLVLSPQSLIASLYTRSLALFTPTLPTSQKPNAAFLPSQILITLVLSSLKLDCASVGRSMLEDWLAMRGRYDGVPIDEEGYEKVLEIYCLHLLPRLEMWDFAKEFLQYEVELPTERRELLKSSLETLHSQTRTPPRPSSPVHSASPPQELSPTPSRSSSSSSLSTTSTHTAVPRTPRPNVISAASMSTTSLSSNSTITNSTNTTKIRSSAGNGHTVVTHWASSRDRDAMSTPSPHALSSARHASPSVYALIKASLGPYLTTSNLTTFLILFIVFPLLSFVLKVRRRRLRAVTAGAGGNGKMVDQVRRRLKWGGRNVFVTLSREIIKAVVDTIQMGGRGLV